jgi:hypothetical protein
VLHILWLCNSAKDAWCVSSRRLQKKSSLESKNFFQLVTDVFMHGDKDEIQTFVGIAHRLWFRRNDLMHGGPLTNPNVVVTCTAAAIEEFSHANNVGEQVGSVP